MWETILLPEGKESISMSLFIFMDMDRRNFQGIVPLCADFIIGGVFVILLDVNQQHMEMQ